MSAIGLYRGPGHVIEGASEEYLAFAGSDPTGMPASEAFPQLAYRPVIEAMDRVYATGRGEVLCAIYGEVKIIPRMSEGRVVGVASFFVESVRPAPARRVLRVPLAIGSVLTLAIGLTTAAL